MNWLDRALSFLSPSRGLDRARARAQMAIMLEYEGAKSDRRNDGWMRPSSSGDAEAGTYHRALRDTGRDLVRNNPHAKKALNVLVSNRVGTGILCSPSGKNARRVEAAADLWKRWADVCDVTRRNDWYGLQSLIERTRTESGECLVRLLPVEVGAGDVPFRLQVLEPDYLDSDLHKDIGDNHFIRYGIEYKDRVAIRYWIFDEHPGDVAAMPRRRGYASTPIDASDMLHVFRQERPQQSRGVSEFHSVVQRLHGVDAYDVAEVMRKRIAACNVAAVTSPAGLPGAGIAPVTTDKDGKRIEQFQPGMVAYMKPGEAITFHDPKPSGDYEQFMSVQLHAIAAGLNMPYELLTGDLSQVTYTSHRGGLVQFRAAVEADQWQLIVPQVCAPVTRRWTTLAAMVNSKIDPATTWEYTPPRFGLLDPAKEIPPMVEALEAGLDSYQNLIRRDGYDWREKLDEIEEFQNEVKKRKLTLTSVPGSLPPPPSAPPPAGKPKREDDEDTEVEDEKAA